MTKSAMVNEALRKLYLKHNPTDELEYALDGLDWWKIHSRHPRGDACVHHIYRGAKAVRYDIWSLMVTVSPASHAFCHAFPREGLVAAVCRKIAKNEFNRDYVRQVTGRDVIEVINGYRTFCDDSYQLMQSWIQKLHYSG